VEKAHWLARKRTSLKLAKSATSAEARLVHFELAGRYGIKALSVESERLDLVSALPPAINENDAGVGQGKSDA
jgi:hypothetical protein